MNGTSPGPETAGAELLVHRDHGVLTITLNRPRRKNSVTSVGWADLGAVLRGIDPREDRVVVLTGAGDTFCAGADLAGNDDSRSHLENMRTVGDTCLALHRVPVPTIAAVDGAAVGAGMNMALACDFVVATDRARFSEIFVRRALSVDFGGSWLLPRLVGLAKAKELVLLGDFVSGAEMKALGLVNDVVAPEALQAAVVALASRLAAGPQTAIMLSKSLLNASFDVSLERALEDEARAQSLNNGSDEAREAADAFLTKREPNYRAPGAGAGHDN
jgi:enoyl-CoA hydratase/carnithine racemase